MASATAAFYKSILDAIPSPIFVAEDDVRLVDCNAAAARLLGAAPELLLRRRGGEVLHCVHASDVPGGCGRGPHCADCVVRASVNASLSGHKVVRQNVRLDIMAGETSVSAHFLVTTAPLEHEGTRLALLILEDISELVMLRGILPICMYCKKIRNDEHYWQTVEQYFSRHTDASFSHGICPECMAEHFPAEKLSSV